MKRTRPLVDLAISSEEEGESSPDAPESQYACITVGVDVGVRNTAAAVVLYSAPHRQYGELAERARLRKRARVERLSVDPDAVEGESVSLVAWRFWVGWVPHTPLTPYTQVL